jgi:hypothetical protein
MPGFTPPPLDDTPANAPATNAPASAQTSARPQNVAGQHTSHAYSEDVRNMQEAMIMFGNQLANMTNVFDVSTSKAKSDTFNPSVTTSIGIDPNTVQLIKQISKNTKGMPAGYADGLWGPKTMAALNAIYGIVKAIDESPALDKSKKAKYDSIVTFLKDRNAAESKWTDINPHGPVADSAREIQHVIETNMNMILSDLKAIADSAAKDAEIPGTRDRMEDEVNQQSGQSGQASQENGIEQVNSTKKSVEAFKKLFPNGFPLPFDLNTNQINLIRIGNFVTATKSVFYDPSIRALGDNDFASNGDAILQHINEAYAQNQSLAQALGGKVTFSIDTDSNQGYENFFQGVATGNDFNSKKASSQTILNRTTLLCNTLVETLAQFQSIETFYIILGTDVLQAQLNKGRTFSAAASSIRDYIQRLTPGQ